MEALLRSSGAVCSSSSSSCLLQPAPNCAPPSHGGHSERRMLYFGRNDDHNEGNGTHGSGENNSTSSNATIPEEPCTKKFTFVVFPLFALFLGALATPLSRKIKVSYTLVLLIIGIILGAVGCGVDLGLLSTSLRQWVHLNPPTAFFYIFLAPLIFEAAFNTRWHVFKRLLIPILTAAFIIVILQVGLISVFQKMVIRTEKWTWMASFMFGSMLSATDPISVTATLKSLGASEMLNTLIEGESLLNDGSAFVLWEAFFENTVEEGTLSNAQIVASIFRLSIGGAAMGVAFGLGAIIVLGLVYDEFEVEVSLTVIVAFLGFWTAQAPSKLSGVICNVASGLVLSAFGRHLITPAVREPLHEFWELLSWIANTIVFVHSGVLLTAFTWSCTGEPNEWFDYLYIFVYYLYLQVIRMGLIMIFLPVMRIKNQWFKLREAFVVGFSGLRGAVSLILALEVAGNNNIPDEVRSRVVLWTTGVVALSLLVNGFLIKPLISKFKLDKAKKSREDFLQRARALMVQKTLVILDSLCIETNYKSTRWSYVLKSVLPHEWLEETTSPEGYRDVIEQVLDNKRATLRKSLELVRQDAHDKIVQSHIGHRMSSEYGTKSVQTTPKIAPLPPRYDYASDIARYTRTPRTGLLNVQASPGIIELGTPMRTPLRTPARTPAFANVPSRFHEFPGLGEGIGRPASGHDTAGPSNRNDNMGVDSENNIDANTAANTAINSGLTPNTNAANAAAAASNNNNNNDDNGNVLQPLSLGSPASVRSSIDINYQRSIDADVLRYGGGGGGGGGGGFLKATPSGIHREIAELHKSVSHGNDEFSEKDREVRRRLLTAILSQVRAISNTSLIEFSVLHNLGEDCQKALDANEECRHYDLFSFLDHSSTLANGPIFNFFIKLVEGRTLHGEMTITTAFIVSGIMTEILTEETLHESPLVRWEAEKLYQGSTALLNRLESLNPDAFEWIESQFAVYVCENKQDHVLHDLLESGMVDDEEYHTLHEELVEVRRAYVHTRQSFLQRNRKKLPDRLAPRQLLLKHPLFRSLNRELMQIVDRYGELVHLKPGQELKSEPGSLVLVLDGLITPRGVHADPNATNGTQNQSNNQIDDMSRTRSLGGGYDRNRSVSNNEMENRGAEMHWCFPKHNAFCGPSVTLLSHTDKHGNHVFFERERTLNTKFICSEIAGKTTVFTLPVQQVKLLARKNEDFRMEITRSLARQIVLESLADQRPYTLAQFTDTVSGGIDIHTVVGRATRVLERLPYMKVISLHSGESSSVHLQGPGVLLNGTIRVSIVDTSGLVGAINLLHEELTGPALLPAGGLLIEEIHDPDDPNQLRSGITSGESPHMQSQIAESASATVQQIYSSVEDNNIVIKNDVSKKSAPPKTAGRKVEFGAPKKKSVLAHVLIEEISTTSAGVDKTAVERIQRWRAPDELVDMNGRFGMNYYVELSRLSHIRIQMD